ncbi:MAG: AEC family transporter [Cellvibrio sp.]
MFSELLAILAPIMISVGAGYIWGKTGAEFPSDFISRIVMYIGTPCLVVGAMAKVELQPELIGQVALATALVMLAMGLIGWAILHWRKMEIPIYLPPLVFPNNGNMGLPLCLLAFGQTGLALALGSFMVMMISTFSIGLMIVASHEGGFLKRMKEVAKQPIIHSMLLSIVILVYDITLPKWVTNTVDMMGGIAIPLMTIALGVSLATLKVSSWGRAIAFSVARVGGGLVLAILVCELLGITGVSRNVVILQCAMPIAVFNYLLALRYDRRPDEVAAMVLVSTLLAFLGLPFLLMTML